MRKILFVCLIMLSLGAISTIFAKQNFGTFPSEKFIQYMSHRANMPAREINNVSIKGCRLVWTHVPDSSKPERSSVVKFGAYIIDLDILESKPWRVQEFTLQLYENQGAILTADWMDESYNVNNGIRIIPTPKVQKMDEIYSLDAAEGKGLYEYNIHADGTAAIRRMQSVHLLLPPKEMEEVIGMIHQAKESCIEGDTK